ncbi:hypothetical protein J8F10_10260 [Gemmata sp. G18]|uniref:Uncharacterized protein n=1 Tax=Gemmata palustris TaxID=2822762 RepID=A0ABS5BS25_9BACT|nr:hypothetical protein [Gemmata palustris]
MIIDHEVIINLIANTTTEQGLRIEAELDTASYPLGTKLTDEELDMVKIKRHKFHGDWNSAIRPETGKSSSTYCDEPP